MNDEIEQVEQEAQEDICLPVQIIAGKSVGPVLVEWIEDGAYHRASIMAEDLQDGMVRLTTLHRGIPYGVAWENYLEITATPATVANELRRRGVWTWEDVNLGAVVAASRAIDIGAFLRKVADGEEVE